VELKVQSGVAAGTLVFGSVKWTDWSVIDTLDYTIAGVVPNRNEYFWKDGWTVSGGVGRQFSEMLSGQVSLTWDQGVSTTEDMLTDTWSFGAGVRMAGDRGAISLGGAVSYLTSGSQSVADGAEFDATVGNDISYAVGGNFLVNF
ncbi:MAG: long-chain fatty acid transporter, partial [Pseudomonadota bacterium]